MPTTKAEPKTIDQAIVALIRERGYKRIRSVFWNNDTLHGHYGFLSVFLTQKKTSGGVGLKSFNYVPEPDETVEEMTGRILFKADALWDGE